MKQPKPISKNKFLSYVIDVKEIARREEGIRDRYYAVLNFANEVLRDTA